MKVNYYNRKYYNRYFNSLCDIIKYKNTCDKKKKNFVFKSDKNIIKKLKLDSDTHCEVFAMLK